MINLFFVMITTYLGSDLNSRPYQQLVFQYSLHTINESDGQLMHKEFLAEKNGQDPRIDFIEKLILDCGDKGDILVYNVGFEKGKLADLALAFPQEISIKQDKTF